jgi:SAM-dependent methyltransferase
MNWHMGEFKDHFSTHSPDYAAHRPGYPAALFDHPRRPDPGPWSGLGLRHRQRPGGAGAGGHYARVVASDASGAQIAAAPAHPGIEFRVAPADASGLPDHCADLVTVAQAAHWFDLPAFYAEARRVLKPGGVLAIWCYERLSIEPALDGIVEAFHGDLLGPYWPPERRHVEAGYRDLPFPFAELPAPELGMEASWNLDQLLGYFSTWSAVKAYRQAVGEDPLPALRESLAAAWISLASAKTIKWPLSVRLGRV